MVQGVPVVRFCLPVVVTLAIGHADGRHQCDAYRSAAEGSEDVSHASAVDTLSFGLAAAVRAVREHDRIHAIDRGSQGVGTSEVTGDHLQLGEQSACFAGIACESADSVAPSDDLLDERRPMLPVAPTTSTVGRGLLILHLQRSDTLERWVAGEIDKGL